MIQRIARLLDERPGVVMAWFFGLLFACQIVFFAIAFAHPPQVVESAPQSAPAAP